ncbi:MAG TPA: amidohydrolase family protein [Vicinamibacterales bacterium]|nr:amidohydrolase family protein [Vicinamibacterales bacterium]
MPIDSLFSATLDGQAAQAGVAAIRGATIVTVTKGTINNGTIVIRDGKIAAVGTNVQIPAGADIYDGTGKFVSPGIIDAHSHIANDAINEGTTSVSSMTGMGDVINPTDISIYRDLAGGLTVANVLHGSANPIGGKTVVIKLRWGKTKAEELLFEGALPGIKFALGENVKRPGPQTGTGPRRYPATRQGVEYVMRDAFTRAKTYQKAWQDYNALKAKNADMLPPKRDLQLDALVEILEGKRLVHCHSYRADEILMMIRVADEMGFKVATFQHVLEGYKVAKEMAAHGAGASTFSDWWGYKIEAEDAIPGNAGLMTHKNVNVSVNSDSAEHARRLNTEAAKSVRWGDITDDQALAMVTLNPARQLRIDNRVGSIEVGKDADFAVWNHHPLSTMAIVERTYIDGIVYYDRIKDEQRAANVESEKALLLGREGGAPPVPADPPPASPAVPRPQAAPEPLRVQYNANGPAWAITNARIFPVSGPVIERGTIVIKGNRILAVGAGASVPSGAKAVDGTGLSVYPGFIDAGTDLGLNEPGVRNYDDVNEMLTFNQMLRTRVAYQSDSDAIPIARVEGITTAAIVPGGGVIAGEIPVMNLDGWTWEENTLRASAGLAMAFPGAGGGGRGGGGGAGAGGGGAGDQARPVDELNRMLDQTRAYMKNANRAAVVNWSLEAFVPILEHRQAMYVNAGTDQAIRDAVAWGEKQGINLVLRINPNSQTMASFLKAHNVPVILGNVLSMPSNEDRFHAYTYQTAGVLAKAGVPFAFSSGGYSNVRLIPFQAGMSVAWGLDRDAAIRALTIDAARILGVDSQVGTLEVGKLANLFVVRGDPLEIRSQIKHVVIAGRDVPLDSKHTDLFKRYMSRQ